jgi:hypothetical protein
MNQQMPIRYKGFWDVPRIFLVQHGTQTFLFDCAFDEDLDDYPDNFKVYAMPEVPDAELPKDWTLLLERALRYLGEIPVHQVDFDATRRKSINATIFNEAVFRDALHKPIAG